MGMGLGSSLDGSIVFGQDRLKNFLTSSLSRTTPLDPQVKNPKDLIQKF